MHRWLHARAGRVIPNARAPSTAEERPTMASGTQLKQPARKNASIRGLRRSSTFKSISSLLLMTTSGPGAQINVLRTSILDMHERERYRWVLHPLSGWKTLWDLISAFVVIFYSWMIPFMLCFDWYVLPKEMKVFLKVLDVWGFLDIALRFRTGVIEYGAVRMNPADIRKAYICSVWFPVDLASTIPFEYFIADPNNAGTRKTIKMIKYIKLPRLLRIGRFLKYVRKYKRYSGMVIALNSLLFLSHVAACLWVAILNPCEGDEHLLEERCQSGNQINMYWIAFHHGVVSMLGISANHIESADQVLSGAYHKASHRVGADIYVWGTFVSVVGAVVTASLYGTIINLMQSWNRAENAFRKRMDQISHEMDALSLPKHIRARVTAYYDYLWLNNRTFSEQLNLLKDEGMSIALRQQIAVYLFKDHLQKIPFFQLATDSVLGMICMQLHQVIYMPDDFIIREGEIGRELFMVVKGIVRVMPLKKATQSAEVKKILLGEGDFFGEIAVVMEVERTRSVKAECVSELCILSRDGFDKILVEFPEFAVAMKRLIIKRVSEMWNSDGKEKIEKMTILADYQMKKIATYNHVRKLRSTAKVIQAFVPRLSKLVKDPVPAEALGMDEAELADLRSEAAAGAPVAILTPFEATDVNTLPEGLDSIRETDQESDSFHRPESPRKEPGVPLRVSSDARVANKRRVVSSPFSMLPRNGKQDGLTGNASHLSTRLENVENHIAMLENKLDDRISQVETKVGQVLNALDRLLDHTSTRQNAMTAPSTHHLGGSPLILPPIHRENGADKEMS